MRRAGWRGSPRGWPRRARGGGRGRPRTAWCRAWPPTARPGARRRRRAKASSATRVSALPKRSRPRALASRRAGSTVSTSTLPPRWAAAIAASAAAVVVLPTPPEPQRDDDLLGRQQLLERADRPSGSVASALAIEPSSSPRASATWRVKRRPVERANSSGRYSMSTSRQGVAQACARWPARVRRSVTASSAASKTRLDVAADGGSRARPRRPGSRRALEHLLLAPAEQLGQHPVDDDGGEVDVGLVVEALDQLDGLVDRHLLRRGDDDDAGARRVLQDVEHPRRLLADQPDRHQLVDALGRRQLADDVAAGDGVDDDEVVVVARRTSHASLPTVRISFTPGAALATKSKVRARGPMRASSGSLSWRLRYSLSDSSVSIDMAKRSGWTSVRVEPGRRRSRRSRPGCPWRRPRRRACACPARRPSRASAGRDGGLADPALAGDEEQPAVEEVEGSRGLGPAGEPDAAVARRRGRARRRRPCRPGTPTWRPLPVGEPQHPAARSRPPRRRPSRRRRRRRRAARPRSPWRCR